MFVSVPRMNDSDHLFIIGVETPRPSFLPNQSDVFSHLWSYTRRYNTNDLETIIQLFLISIRFYQSHFCIQPARLYVPMPFMHCGDIKSYFVRSFAKFGIFRYNSVLGRGSTLPLGSVNSVVQWYLQFGLSEGVCLAINHISY